MISHHRHLETYSLELCGGTHVGRTGDIGMFRLVSEGASAGGVRRIEALTGAGALRQVAADEAALAEAAGLLRARPEELADRVRALLDERKAQGAAINAVKDVINEALTARRDVLRARADSPVALLLAEDIDRQLAGPNKPLRAATD